jgi:hypothetical protein
VGGEELAFWSRTTGRRANTTVSFSVTAILICDTEETKSFLSSRIKIRRCIKESDKSSLWSSGQGSWLQNVDVLFPVRYELNVYMLCRRK